MKFAALVLTTVFSFGAFASDFKTMQAEIIGRVVIDENQTVTCLGTNCPPSTKYYQLVLDDAEILGVGAVDHVVFQDFEKIIGVEKKPLFVQYGGVELKEGVYVVIKAQVGLSQHNNKSYAIASNPEEVKLAPVRYPVILY